MFELSDVITPTGKEIRFEFKKFESNGIRVIQRDYEELIRQTLLGIEKSSSKDYFELSRIRVKRRQLYLIKTIFYYNHILTCSSSFG